MQTRAARPGEATCQRVTLGDQGRWFGCRRPAEVAYRDDCHSKWFYRCRECDEEATDALLEAADAAGKDKSHLCEYLCEYCCRVALTKETALAHAKQCLANPTVQKSHELEGKVARLWAIISDTQKALADLPELNLSNYTSDEVAELNNGVNDVYCAIENAVEAERLKGGE